MTTDLSALRHDYALQSLEQSEVLPDPFKQFSRWFEEAMQSQLAEPNAMTLATADAQGRPSARTVLLKGVDGGGFVFYTNYGSRKGQELDANPRAALLFTWLELERQIRIEGKVERVSAAESKAYFQSRPLGSQIGAWASPQSQPIGSRQVLIERVQELEHQFAGASVLPLPPFWGGYRLYPEWVEFWQGRESRLHDRIAYRLGAAGAWQIERLAP